ncbi:Putative signal peptide peptidase SppA [Aquisphaera giovannonii]|uniref:Signal peptide peptidase SppA n=1 Tax=Aquisphaera giovannonii TaxID=406548 RepID=A0A5B9VXC2_9BACT|nr:signal peptide peptidase SppA [Aquisphaera giovannonii]QEH32607.1 Putative signal peptide peptidase SppA [Aquisphaera giovannonii]
MAVTTHKPIARGLLGLSVAAGLLAGCGHPIPVVATFQGAGNFQGTASVATQSDVRGEMALKLPAAIDPGPLVSSVIRAGAAGAPRVALIDVDGVLLNQNREGLYDSSENPVAGFREKLEAARADGRVAAIVVRIHSPGGGVTACDIMAAELDRFKERTRKPVVACLMDVATSGAYYLAVGGDRIVAHPTTITGGIGAVFNHVNLADAMAQLNVVDDPIKAGPLVDMGSVTRPLDDPTRVLLQEMADDFAQRFMDRVSRHRPALNDADRKVLADGRVLAAAQAQKLHMVDRLGYLDDAIAEAEGLAGASNAEVILFSRGASPARSPYAIAPGPPRLNDMVPLSYPGLDRAKLPTFLYLWQPDPTLPRTNPR